MSLPPPNGKENRMTKLLLAQICRQAEAIQALSQAAMTASASSGGGGGGGGAVLEPLQDCLSMLQLYAGMLDDRRVVSSSVTPQLPQPVVASSSSSSTSPSPSPSLPTDLFQAEQPPRPTSSNRSTQQTAISIGLSMPAVFPRNISPSYRVPSPPSMLVHHPTRSSSSTSSSSSSSSSSTSSSSSGLSSPVVDYSPFSDYGAVLPDFQHGRQPPLYAPSYVESAALKLHRPNLPPSSSLSTASAFVAVAQRSSRQQQQQTRQHQQQPVRRSGEEDVTARERLRSKLPIDFRHRDISKRPHAHVRRCNECQRTNTTQWRRGPNGFVLCNACGIRAFRAKDRLHKEVSLGMKLMQHGVGASMRYGDGRTLAGTGLHQRSTDGLLLDIEAYEDNTNENDNGNNDASGMYDFDVDNGGEEPKRSTIHHILN